MLVSHSKLEIIFSLFAAGLAAVGLFWWMNNLHSQKQLVSVVMAAKNLAAPLIIKESDLKIVSAPRELLPKNGLTQIPAAAGRLLTRSKTENETITSQDLVYNRDPNSDAALVTTGAVGFVLPGSWLSGQMPKIKRNDFISLYFVYPAGRGATGGAGALLRSVPVLNVLKENDSGGPGAVLLNLTSEAVGKLLQAHASQYPLVLVVESAAPNFSSSTSIGVASPP